MYINLVAGIYDQHISVPLPKRFNWGEIKKKRKKESTKEALAGWEQFFLLLEVKPLSNIS